MKTGLLLLQSIASSGLRSGRPHVRRCHWSQSQSQRSSIRSHNAGGAALLAAGAVGLVGLVGANGHYSSGSGTAGVSTLAMCSSSSSTDTRDVTSSTSVATTSGLPKRKTIDEPDFDPEHNPLLPFPESSLRHDTYSGVTLDLTSLTTSTDHSTINSSLMDADAFGDMLGRALEIWASEKRKGIWIKIPTTHSHLISSATNHGFDFQHAEPGYCVLTKWLPKGSASRLPNGPTHQIGIGALVIHPLTGKMLAVQERTGPAAKRKLWKMPTGLTDPGEDVAAAAVRELKEETGLDCVFDKIICIRQAHGGLFNRSDMFFVCLCKLKPEYVERLKQGGEVELLPQEEEILMADWLDMEDYAQQSIWMESPLYKEMNGAMLNAARKGISYSSTSDDCSDVGDENEDDETHGFVAKNLPVGFRPGKNTIYVSSKL